MGKENQNHNVILGLISLLIVPISIYWILARKGLEGILDTLAVGVVVGFVALWAFKWLAQQKIITFSKK